MANRMGKRENALCLVCDMGGRPRRAALVVAADGLHSPLRKSLGLDAPPARRVRVRAPDAFSSGPRKGAAPLGSVAMAMFADQEGNMDRVSERGHVETRLGLREGVHQGTWETCRHDSSGQTSSRRALRPGVILRAVV